MTSPQPPVHTVVLEGRRRWGALISLALGVAMIILDATVVNVAIPTMVKDLHLTSTDAEWIPAAYSLVFASLLILAGRMADRFGRRLIFVIGVFVFVGASVLVAMSGNASEVIGARALQGVGGALMLPASLSIINAVFVGKARAVAFAVWGATIGGMAALGPLVGGWLTTYASWHWAFLINVPIGILVLIGVFAFVPETKETSGPRGTDVPGILLSTLGLLGVVFALIEGQRYGWIVSEEPLTIGGITWGPGGISPAFIAGLLGVICLVLLVVVESRRLKAGKVVVFDLRLFSIRSFGAGNAVALIVSLGEFGLLFAIPLFLQSVRGYDALQTGVILLALAVGSFVAAGIGAGLAQRVGPVRVLQIGMALEALGIIGLSFVISPTITGWGMAPWLFIYGMGVGFATAQLTGVVLSEVPVEQSGQASAMQSTSRQVGAAIGTAILGATLLFGLSANVTSQLQDRGIPSAAADQVADLVRSSAGTAIPSLAQQPNGATLIEGASAGYAQAMVWVAWMAAAFIILGLITSFLLPKNAARVEAEGYAPPTD